MNLIPVLTQRSTVAAIVVPCIRDKRARGVAVYVGAGGVMTLALGLLAVWLAGGKRDVLLYPETEILDTAMLVGEVLLMGLIVFLCVRHKKYPVILLSVGQTALLLWAELTRPDFTLVDFAAQIFGPLVDMNTELMQPHMRVDCLAMLMVIIVAVVGGLICIYAVGYMKAYHHHHADVQDRSGFFFSMLFLFLAAMLGLVLSESLTWMYFFWEITSVISFLLIGYTRTEEAVRNSFRALWINLLGGCGFAVAIAVASRTVGTTQLSDLVNLSVWLTQNQPALAAVTVVPIAMLAFAGLTKSAQLPFSSWLLGAMVAPTPSSALLHSATMVKAGVYLLIRLAPANTRSSVQHGGVHRRLHLHCGQHDGHCPERRQEGAGVLHHLESGPHRGLRRHRRRGDDLGGRAAHDLPLREQVDAVPGCRFRGKQPRLA